MDKDRRTLDLFCRKVARLGMNIFPLAMDSNEKDLDWRTLENGTHFPIKNGESVKEAAQKFISQKRQEKHTARIETGSSEGSGTKASGTGSAGSESLPKVTNRNGDPVPYRRAAHGKEYVSKLQEAKQSQDADKRWRVDVHDAEDYDKHCHTFVTEGGSVVAVVKDNEDGHTKGDIVSVCGMSGKERGRDLLQIAIANGGDRLDSFDGNHDFYVKNGFEPVSWCKWDDEYAPEEWKEANNGNFLNVPNEKLRVPREDVFFYRYTGKKTTESASEFKKRVAASEDYDSAKVMRDNAINGKEKANG